VSTATAPDTYRISVRELVEFTAKTGDLDLRFTPAPTAEEGIAGHARVQARRGGGYTRELLLTAHHESLLLRGRADGCSADGNELEEIKTFRGRLDRIPPQHTALHWAQLKLYGAMHCREKSLAQLSLKLTYFDIVREKETSFCEVYPAAELEQFFEDHCGRFLAWARQEQAHRRYRNEDLATLAFPFAEFHAGQRHLAEAVFRTGRDGGCLMAQAPTGIGKTVGTLFPLLKACARGEIDKIFFLTAKTPGRQLALDAVHRLRVSNPAHPLRLLELVARDKSCVHPDKACHGDSYPLAKGFYDRLPAARAAAAVTPHLDQAAVRRLADEHAICPYYLGQEMARWSDVIVGDYNYYFDGSALLNALTAANDWKVALLVDEAHNLLERGRAMYSAELDQARFAAVRSAAPIALKTAMDRVNREWNRLVRDQEADYQVYAAPPLALVEALGKLTTAITDHLGEAPDRIDPGLQEFLFDALHFRALADVFGPHSIFDVSLRHIGGRRSKPAAMLCLRNVVPAPFLSTRLAAAQSAVLFSATLSPTPFYRDMLGLPEDAKALDVASPFSSDQLDVRSVGHVSTRFPDRARSVAPIADVIAAQYRERPGNYLAFFSSFDYLREVAAGLAQRHADVPQWSQTRGMDEAARTAFLAHFAPEGQGIGFAVLGGAFAEGIDLPGSRLIGAFVATLGQPQVNPVNEQMKECIERLFGKGYDYTYFYPGIQKVVQAAGRVIRTASDEGTLLLIDDRFERRSVRALLPPWWRVRPARIPSGEVIPAVSEPR